MVLLVSGVGDLGEWTGGGDDGDTVAGGAADWPVVDGALGIVLLRFSGMS